VLTNAVLLVELHNGTIAAVPYDGTAKPGDRLRYTIAARNTGDRAAANLVPSVHLPPGERYVGGSAGEDAEFSVDNGKTWSRVPLVRVSTSDGATTMRPALPSEYNAIRWIDPNPLASGARATFGYDVLIE
jgi:uncharacterized repeat protein (TIGR01451 family)